MGEKAGKDTFRPPLRTEERVGTTLGERHGAQRSGASNRDASRGDVGWGEASSPYLSLEKMRLTEPKRELLRLLILASSAAVFLGGAAFAGELAGVESELG